MPPLAGQMEHLRRWLLSGRFTMANCLLPRHQALVVIVRVHFHLLLLLLMVRHSLVLLGQVVAQTSHAILAAHKVTICRVHGTFVCHELGSHVAGARDLLHGLLICSRSHHHAVFGAVRLAEHAELGV